MSEQAPPVDSAEPHDEAAPDAATEFELLRTRAAALEREVQHLREEELRLRAEFDNVRKRIERDFEQRARFANEDVLRELLGVIDSLELGLRAAEQPEASAKSIAEGMVLTQRQLQGVLERQKVTVMDPQGQPFNPELHAAVSSVESTDVPANHVLSVMQKGYRLQERLLRPAMVVVARAPTGGSA